MNTHKFIGITTLLLLCSALQAQTDVTTSYLLNPSFETLLQSDGTTAITTTQDIQAASLYGWTFSDNFSSLGNCRVETESAVSNSEFANAATSGSTKASIPAVDGTNYFYSRKGWGNLSTSLSTTTTSNLPTGTYYLEFSYKAADYSNNNTDNNGTTMNIVVTASGNTLAQTTAYRVAHSLVAGGSNPQETASANYFIISPWVKKGIVFNVTEAAAITFTINQNMVNSGRSDILYDNFRLYDISAASVDNPIEVSGCIVNPGFETGNANSWTASSGGDVGAKSTTNATYLMSNSVGNYLFNSWTGTTTQTQSISQTIDALPIGRYIVSATMGGWDTTSDITLSAGSQTVVNAGLGATIGFTATTSDFKLSGNLTITAYATQFFKIDEVKLFYAGASADKTDLQALVDSATTLYNTYTSANYRTELQAAINAANITLANDDALMEDITAEEEAVKTAIQLYYQENSSEDNTLSFTGYIQNPSFELGNGGTATRTGGSSSGGSVNAPKYWNINYNTSGWHDINSNATTPSDGTIQWNVWSGTTTALDLYQTITLPVGLYRLSADLRSQNNCISNQTIYAVTPEETTTSNILLSPTDYGASSWDAIDAWQTLSTTFSIMENETSVRIGAQSTGRASSVGWFQIDNFQLEMIGNKSAAAYSLLASYIASITANATEYTSYDGYSALITAIGTAQAIYDAATLDAAGVQAAINNLILAERACLWSGNLPYDATAFISNPSFEETDRFAGWNNSGFAAQTNNSFGKTGSVYAEQWVSSGSSLSNYNIYQNINSLPNGIYVVTVTAAATQAGEAADGTYLYANGTTTTIGAENTYQVTATVTDGTLQIGFKTESTAANWVRVDNFQLTYCGDMNSSICNAANMTNISTNAGTWNRAFDPDITEYNITVNMLTSINISATGYLCGNISGTGDVTLTAGSTTSRDITITSINGNTQKTYRLNIYLDNSAILSNHSADWMGMLSCDTRLSKLTVPGTHNSAANSGGTYVQCQNSTIAEQLAAGIRYLDIRLRADAGDSELELCHGTSGLGTYFESTVMAPVRTFLDAHPDEVIFMSIKRDDGDSDTYFSLLQAALASETNLPYLQQYLYPTTTIGDCRGKIIPLHRQLIGGYYYGGRFIDFADNTSFTSYIEVYYGSNITLKAEDYYACGYDYDSKISAVTTLLASSKANSNSDNTWFLTYTSGTINGLSIASPANVANNVGPAVLEWLQAQGLGNYGIVPMDYVGSSTAAGPALTQYLINCNTQYMKTDTMYYAGTINMGEIYSKNGFNVQPTQTGTQIYTEERFDNGGCSYIAKLTLTVNSGISTDMTQANNNKIEIWAANQQVYIHNMNNTQTVQIYDIAGNCIYNGRITNGTNIISLPTQGLFVVKTETATVKVSGL